MMETLSWLKPCGPPSFVPPKSISPPVNPTRTRPSFNALVVCYRRNEFSQNFRFHGLNLTIPCRKQHTMHRNTVVRSEISMSGSPNAGYSVTGHHLGELKKTHFLNLLVVLISHPSNHFLRSPEFDLGPRIRGICFYTVSAAVTIFLFLVMAAVHPFVLLFDRHRRRIHHLVAKIWATVTIALFYKFEFEGLENLPPQDGPAVYVSNHQSFLDIYTLLTVGRSFKFISKTSIFLIPIIGWAMFLMGVIPLRRMDNKSQLDCLKRCMDLVRKGASVFFFPEGTRSKDRKLGMFKKGAFSVAAKTGVPVVPITLLGTGKLMPAGMEGILNSGSVKVVVHKPIEGRDADMLCKQARNVIADTLILHGYEVHSSE